jgi:ribosomal protein L23
MVNVEGKATRRGATTGRRGDYKKALVTLPKGKTIAIHEGV